MRIINNSGSTLQYLVTPSGTTLSGSPIIASGYIQVNSASQFNVDGAGTHPIVYVKSVSQGSKGFTGRQVSNGNATVNITMTEE
jgi:hypothetical protein